MKGLAERACDHGWRPAYRVITICPNPRTKACMVKGLITCVGAAMHQVYTKKTRTKGINTV